MSKSLNFLSTLCASVAIVALGSTALATPGSPDAPGPTGADAINAIVGDASLDAAGLDATDLDDRARIRLHLAWIERTLRAREVSHLDPAQRRARARQLDALRSYWQAGAFPSNDDHDDARRPTFIDREGNICAVGFLIEVELGRELAEAVAADFKYGYIHQIDAPLLEAFVDHSGLSLEELSMIQPSYDHMRPPRPPIRPPVRPPIEPPPFRPPIVQLPPRDTGVDRAFDKLETQVNSCIAKHTYDDQDYPEPWLPVTLTWDAEGNAESIDYQLPVYTDKLDACIQEVKPQLGLERGGSRQSVFRLVRIQTVG